MNTTEKLAREFARLIRLAITNPGAMHFIQENSDPNDAVCYTGDYCDSNMVMDEAFTKVTGHEIDMENDADRDLWNEAWTMAKANRFYPERTREEVIAIVAADAPAFKALIDAHNWDAVWQRLAITPAEEAQCEAIDADIVNAATT
jgi:hypothetical protein